MTTCTPLCLLSVPDAHCYVGCQHFCISFQYFHTEANLIPGALAEDPIPDPLPQEANFAPTDPREGGQCPDLGLLPGKSCQ